MPQKLKKTMEEPFKSIGNALTYIFGNAYGTICGVFTTFLAYFLPVKDIVHLLILFFIVDVIFGYIAAHKLRKERFSVKIIWGHTIPRMMVSLVLILGAFMWDKVYCQELLSTYKMIGWFISGVLLYSIAENGYQITKWSIFPKIGRLISNKVQENTGLEIPDEEGQKKQLKDGQANN